MSCTRKVIEKYTITYSWKLLPEVEVQILSGPLPYDDADVAGPRYQPLIKSINKLRGRLSPVKSGSGATFSQILQAGLLSVKFLRAVVPR